MAGMIDPLSFDRYHQLPRYHLSWDARRDLDYSPSLFQDDFRFCGNGFVDCQLRFASQNTGNTVLARW